MNTTTETTTNTNATVGTQAATVGAQAAPVAPAKAKGSKATNPTKKAATAPAKSAKAKKAARSAKAKPATTKKAVSKPAAKAAKKAAPRDGSKKQIVLSLLGRKSGATLAAIMKATDWQTHTVRGFISGMLGKRMGLTIESTRSESGERTYKIAK
jgi:hypothetical protein